MKKLITSLFVCLLFTFSFAFSVCAQSDGSVGNSMYIIDDSADLFSASEEAEIESALTSCLENASIDSTILIVTTDSNPYEYSTFLADEYLDNYTDVVGYPDDKLIYLIDMDTRELWIGCDGAYIGIMDYDSIQRALDYAYSDITDGYFAHSAVSVLDYVSSRNVLSANGCFELTVDGENIDMYLISDDIVASWNADSAYSYPAVRSGAYVLLYNPPIETFYNIEADGSLTKKDGDESAFFVNPDKYDDPSSDYYDPDYDYDNYDPDTSDLSWAMQTALNAACGGVVGLVLGVVIVLIFRLSVKLSAEGARRAANDHTTGERVALSLTRSTDTLIDTKTTRRYIPPPTSNSGGGGFGGGGGHSFGGGSTHGSFHSSGGGHSFSGGGRKF